MSSLKDPLLRKIESIRPHEVLDVGCGCGRFTSQVAVLCSHLTAVDISQPLVTRSAKERSRGNLAFACMDATHLSFRDNAFDLVLERASLHHIEDWPQALDEMVRVSADYVVIEEPVDEPCNEPQKASMVAQRLYLELQREAGYSHFEHIEPSELISVLDKYGLSFEISYDRSGKPTNFDEFFEQFFSFASRTPRPDYWANRLEHLRAELSGKPMQESDSIIIVARKA